MNIHHVDLNEVWTDDTLARLVAESDLEIAAWSRQTLLRHERSDDEPGRTPSSGLRRAGHVVRRRASPSASSATSAPSISEPEVDRRATRRGSGRSVVMLRKMSSPTTHTLRQLRKEQSEEDLRAAYETQLDAYLNDTLCVRPASPSSDSAYGSFDSVTGLSSSGEEVAPLPKLDRAQHRMSDQRSRRKPLPRIVTGQ